MAVSWTEEMEQELVRKLNTGIKPGKIAEQMNIDVKAVYSKIKALKNKAKESVDEGDKDPSISATTTTDTSSEEPTFEESPKNLTDFQKAAAVFKKKHHEDVEKIRQLEAQITALEAKLSDATTPKENDAAARKETAKLLKQIRDELQAEKKQMAEASEQQLSQINKLNEHIDDLTSTCDTLKEEAEMLRSKLAEKVSEEGYLATAELISESLYYLNADEQEIIKQIISQILYDLKDHATHETLHIYSKIFSTMDPEGEKYIEHIKLLCSILDAIDHSQGEKLELEVKEN